MPIPNLKRKYVRNLDSLLSVLKTLKPAKVILFGSGAKLKIHEDSDIDICLVKDDIDPILIKHKITDLLWKNKYSWEPEPDIKVYETKRYKDLLTELTAATEP